MFGEDLPTLSPLSCFDLSVEVFRLPEGKLPLRISKQQKNQYLLPNTSLLTGESLFATFSLGWHPEGLAFHINVAKPIERVSYPDFRYTDSVEIFLDTRNSKSSGTTNRFCHHFYFLPEPYLEHFYGEITRFRTEDTHPHCSSESLFVSIERGTKEYQMDIFLPRKVLVGYDPAECSQIGFTYRMNQPSGNCQSFAVSQEEFSFEQQPALWSTLLLVQEKSR